MSKKPSKRGGKRAGAGRPEGSKNTLNYGDVRALAAARLRVPADATKEHAELAGIALQRIVDVMMEDVTAFQASTVLKAATVLREEVCGSVTQKHQHAGAEGGPLEIVVRTVAEGEDTDQPEVSDKMPVDHSTGEPPAPADEGGE